MAVAFVVGALGWALVAGLVALVEYTSSEVGLDGLC